MKAETRSYYEAAVVRAAMRVAASLDEALDLNDLARGAALSSFHFHRIFRALLGETPLELHRRLRLERAAEELGRTDRSVTEIAFGAGYETHEAFTRAFRAHFSVAPSTYRERALDAGAACHGGPVTRLATRSGLHFHDGRVELATLTLTTTGGPLMMDVDLVTLPARRLATVRHTGPYPEIAEAFHRLGSIAAQSGLYARALPQMLALYHDDPETTAAADLRSDAALVVVDAAPLPDGLEEVTVPAGRYARVTHKGAYSGLGDAWARLMGTWLPGSGLRVGGGPSYEVYVNDPRTTATDDLRTDLFLPIAG